MSNNGRVVHWNPRRRPTATFLGRTLPLAWPVNNFGDLLGPRVVSLLAARHGVGPSPMYDLLAVGSILHLAHDADVVWGAGRNGKNAVEDHKFTTLDVRAVRGPRTREFLRSMGIAAPETYGDPALLLPHLDPRMRRWAATPQHEVTVVPNMHDYRSWRGRPGVLNPRSRVDVCLRRIAQSRLVVGSSLHGIVVAESLGIPARLVRPGKEDEFKYHDYYEGTGRTSHRMASDVSEAIRWGGEPGLDWCPNELLAAFPLDLFS